MDQLEIIGVSKHFRNHEVLKNVDLILSGGHIYGLCGENGCGKTVLLKIICSLMMRNEGEVLYNGKDIKYAKPSYGVVFGQDAFFEDMSGFQNLKLLSGLRNVIQDDDIKNMIVKVGLDPEDRRPVKKYSLGMKQRLTIAQALMEPNQILLLDEPTNALDESGVALIHALIKEEKANGKIVVLTSHNRYDIESLCDTIYYIKNGSVVENAK